MDGSGVVLGDQAPEVSPELTPNEIALLSLSTVVFEMMRAIEEIMPGRFDRALQADRRRLQQIEAGRVERAFPFEDEILRKRIDHLEAGLGRKPTLPY